MQIKQKIDLKSTKGRFVWFGLFAFMFCFSFNPSFLSKANRYVADSTSYLSHFMTIALDFDMDYSNEIRQGPSQNRYLPPHPIGSGVMAAPFVALFSIFDRVSGHPIINDHKDYKYSWSIFGFILSAYLYFFLTVYLYWDSLRLIFTETSLLLVTFLSVSTGILFYVLNATALAHAFEFAGVAFLFWTSVKLFFSKRRKTMWLVVLTAAMTINFLIRYNNLNLIIIPFFLYFFLLILQKEKIKHNTMRATIFRLTAAIAAACIFFSLYNLYFFNSMYASPDQVYGENVKSISQHNLIEMVVHLLKLAPNTFLLIFGSEFGILYSNPVLVFGFVFMLLFLCKNINKDNKTLCILAICSFLAYYFFDVCIALWFETTGSSYGYRFLYPLYPLTLLGVLLWINRSKSIHGSREKKFMFKVTSIAFYFLCIMSLCGQLLVQSTDSLSFKKQVNMYGLMHTMSFNGYNKHLLTEIVKPKTWFMAGAKRFPGFMIGPALMKSPLRERIPATITSEYEKHYADIPKVAYLQALGLFSSWMFLAFIVYKLTQETGVNHLITRNNNPE
ncbi:MAG: hypothetical protein GY845_32540 [Planctomycetes bacterium]|nr:hypothetical protein [Planctomycetota bacterium]